MVGDPEYRELLEKHWLTMGMMQPEGVIKERAQEKIHQVQKAISEIERKEMQCRHGATEGQLNLMMRKLRLEQMEVAEVYSPPRIV